MVLNLGTFSCMLNTLVFDLGSLDMVLGMEWLKTLGEVLHNWKEHSMRLNTTIVGWNWRLALPPQNPLSPYKSG